MITRHIESEIAQLQQEFPIVAILGPRQSGKTTLAKKLFSEYEYVSLEDYDIRDFATADPRGFLNRFSRQVIFDEIQRAPKLMNYLQTHVDMLEERGTIIITGSHNFLLMEQITQSLAGRVGLVKLLPFSTKELFSEPSDFTQLSKDEILFSGLYPRIYDQHIRPMAFYRNYISTYVEKDVRQIISITNLDKFSLFLKLLAARTGQELNISAISEACGVAHNTITQWISVLEASFIIYLLRPYYKNYNKRLVKRPKLYFLDTGLVCNLLGIKSAQELSLHHIKGSLFETFVVSELLKGSYNSGETYNLYFWRDNHRKEIDLIIDTGTEQKAVEIKSSETFRVSYLAGLQYWQGLSGVPDNQLYVVYGGETHMKREGFSVVAWQDIYGQLIDNYG